ncbi:MAG: hypothetical protein ACTSXJ_06260 [Candidatus Baldrarchaeia archaeon]
MSDSNIRRRQGIFALISGVLMIAVGIRGSAAGYVSTILKISSILVIPFWAIRPMLMMFSLLAMLGGVSVIIGGLIHLEKGSSVLANIFIGCGSGIGVFNVVTFTLGATPAIKVYLAKKVITGIVIFGIDYALAILAMIFALFAMIKDILGFLLGALSGILVSLSASLTELLMVLTFLVKIGIAKPSSLVIQMINVLFLSGVLFVLGGILYGFMHYKLGAGVILFGLIFFSLPIAVLITSVALDVVSIMRIVFGLLGFMMALLSLVYGLQKSRPTPKKLNLTP